MTMKHSDNVLLLPIPENLHGGEWTPGAIPKALRDWGYYPDTDAWQPGDVILTRAACPDLISAKIQEVQAISYGTRSAVWTHAAVYLGDDGMLCEAQLDPARSIRHVQVVRLWDYVGSHELLVRRSQIAESRDLGWAIAVAAATEIGAAYDWKWIAKVASERAFVGEEVFLRDQASKVTPRTFICSSLYSTAHAYVTEVSITDKTNGICVPAYLASTPKLRTIEFTWKKIAGGISGHCRAKS
jgi:hypothetical protein